MHDPPRIQHIFPILSDGGDLFCREWKSGSKIGKNALDVLALLSTRIRQTSNIVRKRIVLLIPRCVAKCRGAERSCSSPVMGAAKRSTQRHEHVDGLPTMCDKMSHAI